MQGKTAVRSVENAGENNSWFTVFTVSMTALETHMGVTPRPPPPPPPFPLPYNH